MRRDQIGKTNENLNAHLFVPGQRILLWETTVTKIEKTWRIEIEQRSLYVHGWFNHSLTNIADLTLLHSERPKLYTILAFVSAIGFNKFRF